MRTPLLLLLTAACTQYVSVDAPPESGAARQDDTVRLVSWNIETIGDVGSDEYDAALQIIARLDPDVVALQEVEWSTDEHSLYPFAADAGYDHVVSGWPVSWGEDTQVILSRHPIVGSQLLDGPELSGDPLAHDLTRSIPVATIDIDGHDLIVATAHFKASEQTEDRFRRTVDAMRGVQALGDFDPTTDRVVFCGDINDDIQDAGDSPSWWNWAPNGLSSTYQLGADLQARLDGGGFANGAFWPFEEAGLTVLDALQLDGNDITRPASGRRLDYFFVSDPVAEGARLEVYDTDDEGLGGLPKAGSAPTVSTLSAADHLPVILDLVIERDDGVPTTVPDEALSVFDLVPGDLRITEAVPNPAAPCGDSEGEWVEFLNDTDATISLAGLELCDERACTAVDTIARLEPGGVAVVARTPDACGLPVDGTFGRPLNNSGDRIALVAGGVELDAVDYVGAGPGESFVYAPDTTCSELGGGTPGVALDCEGLLWGGQGSDPVSVADVPHGVLSLSELMPNPYGCTDESSEWIEVHNTSSAWHVDLSDLHLADRDLIPEPIATDRVLAPGERALFARTLEACDLPSIDGTFTPALSNGGDDVLLMRPDGQVLDEMTYTYAPSGDVWAKGSWGGYCHSDQPTPGAANLGCD